MDAESIIRAWKNRSSRANERSSLNGHTKDEGEASREKKNWKGDVRAKVRGDSSSFTDLLISYLPRLLHGADPYRYHFRRFFKYMDWNQMVHLLWKYVHRLFSLRSDDSPVDPVDKARPRSVTERSVMDTSVNCPSFLSETVLYPRGSVIVCEAVCRLWTFFLFHFYFSKNSTWNIHW